MANTSQFLDNEDLQNINRSYALAFLSTKGVNHLNFDPIIDNYWNFGPFEDGLLIRTDNASFFSAFTWPQLTGKNTDVDAQVIGSAVHEKFLDLIAFLMARQQAELALENVDFAFYLNHNNVHHTCLLVRFEGLNGEEYKKLYQAYQVYSTENNLDKERRFRVHQNNIRNFLQLNQNIILNHRDPDTGSLVLSNWKLPIPVGAISLRHIDSLGINERSHRSVMAACKHFVKSHSARFYKVKTLTTQSGNTCGDWSVYNSYRFAVIQKRLKNPTSIELRTLTENKTPENAGEILFKEQPQLTSVNKGDQVNVAARDFPEEYEAMAQDNQSIEPDDILDNSPLSFIKDNIQVGVAILAVCFLINPLITIAWTMMTSLVGVKAAFAGVTITAAICLFSISLSHFWGKKPLNEQQSKDNQPASVSLETEAETKQDKDLSATDNVMLHQYAQQKDHDNPESIDNGDKIGTHKSSPSMF